MIITKCEQLLINCQNVINNKERRIKKKLSLPNPADGPEVSNFKARVKARHEGFNVESNACMFSRIFIGTQTHYVEYLKQQQ